MAPRKEPWFYLIRKVGPLVGPLIPLLSRVSKIPSADIPKIPPRWHKQAGFSGFSIYAVPE